MGRFWDFADDAGRRLVISMDFRGFASYLDDLLPDSPEKDTGLAALLEAEKAFRNAPLPDRTHPPR